jgi:hypothetical protein
VRKTGIVAIAGVLATLGCGRTAPPPPEWNWQGPGELFLVEKHSGETWKFGEGGQMVFLINPSSPSARAIAARAEANSDSRKVRRYNSSTGKIEDIPATTDSPSH